MAVQAPHLQEHPPAVARRADITPAGQYSCRTVLRRRPESSLAYFPAWTPAFAGVRHVFSRNAPPAQSCPCLVPPNAITVMMSTPVAGEGIFRLSDPSADRSGKGPARSERPWDRKEPRPLSRRDWQPQPE